ncbi:hypothetical protein [Microvirga sp. KLBC 81]|uniref:hypothetical protein n=1 Tax=Microvirga sp. KLBC 81 TaxID=1862707 RepID=UPI001057669B|nr:hypothetical protein [Microvirga sp. KLBC 81]
MTTLTTSTERCKAAHNDKSRSTLTHSPTEAHAIRTIMRRARVSQAQATLVAELHLFGRAA